MSFGTRYQGEVAERTDRAYWRCRKVYISDNASARALENTLWGGRHTEYSGASAPQCHAVRRETNWIPGLSRVLAFYKTPREPGKARIRVIPVVRRASSHDLVDALGNPLTGAVTTKVSGKERHIVKGMGFLPHVSGKVILETAYEADGFDLDDFEDLKKKINAGSFYHFRAGTLFYLGAACSHQYGQDIVDVDHVFLQEAGGWNSIVQTQDGVWVAEAIRVTSKDSNGNDQDAGYSRVVMVFKPGMEYVWDATNERFKLVSIADAGKQERQLYETDNFSDLAGLLEW